MGNRAVITTQEKRAGVFVHWNGGPESVYAFLDAAKELGIRGAGQDDTYFLGRLAQIIGNFFGGVTSMGVNVLELLDQDNMDNGVYVVGNLFEVVERLYAGDVDIKKEAEEARKDKHYIGVKKQTIKANKKFFKADDPK